MPAFVLNANIKAGHLELRDMLMMLRFTRAEYKWSEHAEYSYFTLEPPADEQLGSWNENAVFTALE